MKRIYARVPMEVIRQFLIDNKCSLETALREGLIGFPKREMYADAAFTFRMGNGFPGDITRIEATSIEPCLIDPTNPPLTYGQAVLMNTASGGVRQILASDSAATDIYGVTVRPFPLQQPTATNFGAVALAGQASPPVTGVIDVIRSGYVLVNLNNFAAQPSVKGGGVDVWFAATANPNTQSFFNAVHSGGNSFTITGNTKTTFNGPPDANGFVELALNI